MAISGSSIGWLFVQLVIAVLIYLMCDWVIEKIPGDETLKRIIKAVAALLVFAFVINALLGLAGRSFITF